MFSRGTAYFAAKVNHDLTASTAKPFSASGPTEGKEARPFPGARAAPRAVKKTVLTFVGVRQFINKIPKSFDSQMTIIYIIDQNQIQGAATMPDESQLTLQLREITDCFSSLNIIEKRCLNDEFVEMVFQSQEVGEWQRILSAFLGDPTKPQGMEPSENDLKVTSTTGGIRINQTLFENEFENGTIIAKFWPWEDNTHITLKMALLMK